MIQTRVHRGQLISCKNLTIIQQLLKTNMTIWLVQGAAATGDLCAKLQSMQENNVSKVSGISPKTGVHESPCATSSHVTGDVQNVEATLQEASIGEADELWHSPPELEEGACPALASDNALSLRSIKFAIIGSGYELTTPEHADLRRRIDRIELPSLHVYREHGDRQVSSEESVKLLEWFSPKTRHLFKHNKGHTLPADKVSVGHVRTFLKGFL